MNKYSLIFTHGLFHVFDAASDFIKKKNPKPNHNKDGWTHYHPFVDALSISGAWQGAKVELSFS